MELKYKQALEEYKINETDLPHDARVGIRGIGEIMRSVTLAESKGKKATQGTLDKIAAMDKWVYFEILDHVQGTNDNEEKTPEEVKKEVKEIKTEVETASTATTTAAASATGKETPEETDKQIQLGLAIEAELEKMVASARKEWDIESIKPLAPKTYALLFDTYEDGSENGIKTSKHSLMETSARVFTLN